MRWLTIIGLAGALAFFAAACGSDSDGADGAEPRSAEETAVEPEAADEADDASDADGEMDESGDAPAEPGDDSGSEPAMDEATDSESDTDTELVRGEIQESFVGATLAPYSAEAIVEDEVKVYWNNGSNGTLIAIYHGPGLTGATGLCPGNSLNASGAFEYVSNSPIDAGACEGFPTPEGSVRRCTGDVWLYETLIPNDSEGTLWGSMEMNSDSGIVGMSSQALNTPGTPVIDYSADTYSITAMFTTDGSTEISCDPPLT